VARFNQMATELHDPYFGRTQFDNTITGPYMVRVLAPSTHYTNGGLTTDLDARVLRTDGSVIPNLWAAGEIMGGIHGGNRLGGNAVAEAFVFGRIAGAGAAANAR
jgi:succinate dehydrogenase/fumarate reductase flavoprotein subunit